jgi:D-aspartate ligase
MLKNLQKNEVALVLGGHVNGYSIIKELSEESVNDIALFDYGSSISRFSNKVIYKAQIDKKASSLKNEIKKLHQKYEYIVIFPTDDLQLENLHNIYDEVSDFCYLPFNKRNLLRTLDKFYQYETCEACGVPYPKTKQVKRSEDLNDISSLMFPLLIKPSTRKDMVIDVFRTLYLETLEDYESNKLQLISFVEKGVEFVVSEYIPGDDTNIYAYTCFRTQEGEILNEWSGKKLTQYPDNYGVFCSASNKAPKEVLEQGRVLVEEFNAFGIIEPEFKYDYRDGKYKLMETNLRSMMWHRTGSISGVKLHETQYNYATGRAVKNYNQDISKSIHFVLMLHEISNLIARKGYWKHFKYNVFEGHKRCWAIFEWRDIKPFFYSLFILVKMGAAAWLRRFGLR